MSMRSETRRQKAEGRRQKAGWAYCLLLTAYCLLLVGCDTGASSSGDKVRLVITPVETPTPTPLAAPTMAPTTYTVRAGDTLSGVADLFGVSVDDIVRAN